MATGQIQLTFLYRFKLGKFYNSLQHTQIMQCQSVAVMLCHNMDLFVTHTTQESIECLYVHPCLCKTMPPVFVHVLAALGTGASHPAGTLMM